MRLQTNRLTTYTVRPKVITKDGEGVPSVSYEDGFEVKGYMWKAESKAQIERYGNVIENVSNLRLQGRWTVGLFNGTLGAQNARTGEILRLGDGLNVYTDAEDAPDFVIRSLTAYKCLLLEVEHVK